MNVTQIIMSAVYCANVNTPVFIFLHLLSRYEFSRPDRTKITKTLLCPKCGSNDIRVHEEIKGRVIYTVNICNQYLCGFGAS